MLFNLRKNNKNHRKPAKQSDNENSIATMHLLKVFIFINQLLAENAGIMFYLHKIFDVQRNVFISSKTFENGLSYSAVLLSRCCPSVSISQNKCLCSLNLDGFGRKRVTGGWP